MNLAKSFEPADIEQRWYDIWEKRGYFSPSEHENSPAFSIQLPPPNVTGTLHMGHAFNQTIMDSLVRFYRMQGYRTLWLPGTDHAGIATQIVVERQLAKLGHSREELGRQAFVDKVWEWKAESGGTITQQMRRMGCSVDWSKEYFTMDTVRARAVNEVFVRLFEQGLIYRGKRLVNWDPQLSTAVSDLEVEAIEEKGQMWYIRYPVEGNEDTVVVATTRPETMLGDVAVAVHPADERYAHLVGKFVVLPLTGRLVPIIADDYVDSAFGTGCVKITPAHDFNDYQVGKRHNTYLVNVMTLSATIRDHAEVVNFDGKTIETFALPDRYAGLDRFAAREAIVAELAAQGLLAEIKPHTLMVPRGDRTGSVIEPMLTDQWFVAMDRLARNDPSGLTLAEKALDAVSSGQVRFIPEQWVNTYQQWMVNIQDWCISRQLWWGHQIPAWYDKEGNVYVAQSEEEALKQAGGRPLTRDPDVLDTWFSSALVPFSSLGWPDDTPALGSFLPSTVLVTGYEIIFFWVARMITLTTHFLGKVPFRDVYIHGMVRDHEGKKMSKSEGNVIDPVDLIDGIALAPLLQKRTTGLRRPEKAQAISRATQQLFPNGIPAFGCDALRLTMASYATLGRSINFDLKRCEGYQNFCNKLWNATRFVLMNVESNAPYPNQPPAHALSVADKWVMGRLYQAQCDVTKALSTYRFDLAAQACYEFIWNEYCDWYIELAKVQLIHGNEAQQGATRWTLVHVLEVALRLMHPIAPFITEELWQSVAPLANAKHTDSIMLSAWPAEPLIDEDPEASRWLLVLKDIINAVRNLRGQMGIGPATRLPLLLEGQPSHQAFLAYIKPLAKLSDAHLVPHLPEEDAPIAVVGEIRLMLKMEVDPAEERVRLSKQLAKLEVELTKLTTKLEKPGYVDKAPPHLVERDQQQLAEKRETYNILKAQLAKFT